MSLQAASWKLRVETTQTNREVVLKGFWESAGWSGNAWKAVLIELGMSDCYSDFAVDFPYNQILDDVCEQWKEKGLWWLLSYEFPNAMSIKSHSFCYVNLDF